MIGCDCATCRSTDPRDSRWRPSIFVETDDGAVAAGRCRTRPARAGAALRHPARRRDPVHPRPRRSHPRARRRAPVQRAAAAADAVLRRRADARRHPHGRSATSSIPRRRTAAACRSSSCSRSPGRSASAARRSCRCRSCTATRPILGLPLRRLRLPDRLQPHPRRVLAAARGSRRAGARRAARAAAPDAFLAGEAIEAARRIAPRRDLLHAHVPRSAARRRPTPACRRAWRSPMMAW